MQKSERITSTIASLNNGSNILAEASSISSSNSRFRTSTETGRVFLANSKALQANKKIFQNHSLRLYKLKTYAAIYYKLNQSVP